MLDRRNALDGSDFRPRPTYSLLPSELVQFEDVAGLSPCQCPVWLAGRFISKQAKGTSTRGAGQYTRFNDLCALITCHTPRRADFIKMIYYSVLASFNQDWRSAGAGSGSGRPTPGCSPRSCPMINMTLHPAKVAVGSRRGAPKHNCEKMIAVKAPTW